MSSTPTATIRVPVEVRDRISSLASAEGSSIAAYLDELSWQAVREAVWAGVREEVRLDELNPAAAEEYALWDSTAGDGVDD